MDNNCCFIHLAISFLRMVTDVSVITYYIYRPSSKEYSQAMAIIAPLVEEHHKTMKRGTPQLNYCSKSVMVIAHNYDKN